MTPNAKEKTMLAFKNSQDIKAEWVAMGEAHRAADIIRGGEGYQKIVGEKFTGCTAGCYAEHGMAGYDYHGNVASRAFLPRRLVVIVDPIFEGLYFSSKNEGQQWHTEWLSAIPVGAEHSKLEIVCDKLILKATLFKADCYGSPDNKYLLAAAALYQRRVSGDEPSEEAWQKAALAARDARDARDALAARDARDALAARAARDALAALAARAALAALAARDALDARGAFYQSLRVEYLKLMGELS